MKKSLLLIILGFNTLFATNLQEANRLYMQAHFKSAMTLYEKLVEDNNDIEAMYNIANMYYLGQGVLQDFNVAYDWYERAADEGDALSMYNISLLYERGEGVDRDSEDAFEWCEKAAEVGLPLAMYKLGLMYIKGYGVEQDMSEAKEWINRAYLGGISQAKLTWDKNKLWKY